MIIKIGNVSIGTDYIPIQSMIKNPVHNTSLTIEKINKLASIGCDIIRITIPDETCIEPLKEVIKNTDMPIVADIHFDYKLAILSIKAGVHKIRINPGNIGSEENVKKVIDCLKEYKIPVRIGINSGSLPQRLKDKFDNPVDIMIESAKEELDYFDKYNYDKIVLSFKSSNVLETIEVNKLAKKKFGLPLHIGVTEAGDLSDGTIKNSIGISHLLLNGIGDTIRVSLTSGEEEEVLIGKKILESVGKRKPELEIVSCPTCGRTEVSIESIVAKFKADTVGLKFVKQLKISIMGCVVNGPGEAEKSDFGVACGKDKSILFKNGVKLKTIENKDIIKELFVLLNEFILK